MVPTKIMIIPQLELSVRLPFAELVHEVYKALKLNISSVNLWPNSTIALDEGG